MERFVCLSGGKGTRFLILSGKGESVASWSVREGTFVKCEGCFDGGGWGWIDGRYMCWRDRVTGSS